MATRKPKSATTTPTRKPSLAVTPEVVPGAPAALAPALRHEDDKDSMLRLEASIKRDIALSGKLDKAGAMVCVKIGLALQAGKSLLRHGEYESWVVSAFGEVFSARKAQYYAKLSASFLRSQQGAALALPPPREAGNWLVVADDGSALQQAVEAFVGDQTIGELLDKHGVRPARAKGGWRPASWLVRQYQADHPDLQGKPFDTWTQEQQAEYRTWQEKQVAGDDAAARRMAAEGTWASIRATLSDHGIGRKSFMLLPRRQMEETRDLCALIVKEMSKALKGAE